MHCFHIFLRCVDILATLTILSHGNAERLQTYLRSDMENHAQFVSHYDSILNIPHMASLKVHDSMTCVVQCVRHEVCHSVNFAVDTDGRGYHFCELLPSDKYQFPDEFEKSYSHHHYSIAVRSIVYILEKLYILLGFFFVFLFVFQRYNSFKNIKIFIFGGYIHHF